METLSAFMETSTTTLWVLAVYWLFSSFIQAMPKPEVFGNDWRYLWMYNFLQFLGANIGMFVNSKGKKVMKGAEDEKES